MAAQLRVSYPTVLKGQDIVRRAIVAQALDATLLHRAGVWAGPGGKRPESAMRDSPVFGIIDVGGVVICDTLPELTPEELLLFKCNFRLRTASFGRVVYTAPYRNYLAMACCGPSLWPTDLVRHEDKRLPLDATDFWGLVKQRLGRVRGLPPVQFPLYLKEMELRYNCRNRDLLGVLAKALCAFVPDG